jgi:hypothetical protein
VKWFFRSQLREQEGAKMKQSFFVCMTVAVVFGCSVASVKADDLFTPPWTRNTPGTTWEAWTFTTSANPSAPDEGSFNLYGTPQATINAGTSQWSPLYNGHIGVWTLGASDSIDFGIPNTPLDPTKYKIVWTQLFWQPDNNGTPVVMVNGVAGTLVQSQAEPGGWIAGAYQNVLPQNPAFEDVLITGSLPGTTFDLGEVFIDTICVPEPSSLALLAMGALSLLPYALRKRRLAA